MPRHRRVTRSQRRLRTLHDDLRQHSRPGSGYPRRPPRRCQRARFFPGPPCGGISNRGSPRKFFRFANDSEKEQARAKFLARLAATIKQRSIGAYPASAEQKRAFYLFHLRPGADLAQLLHSVCPLQRELDVVLLHDGILEPALGITLQAASKEMNLTYEREAGAAIAAVDAGRAQVSFLLNPVDVEKVVQIATGNRSHAAKIHRLLPQAPKRHHHVPHRILIHPRLYGSGKSRCSFFRYGGYPQVAILRRLSFCSTAIELGESISPHDPQQSMFPLCKKRGVP